MWRASVVSACLTIAGFGEVGSEKGETEALEDDEEWIRLEQAGKERRTEREEKAVAASWRPTQPAARKDIVEDGVRKS